MMTPLAITRRTYVDASVFGGVLDAASALLGYREVAIHSPSEVIAYEDEEDV